MSSYRNTLFGFFLLLFSISPVAIQAQVSAPVAILVVDVFEVLSPPVDPEPIVNETCVITPDGQDGAQFGGVGITSALHPFGDPHGRLVYSEVQALLWNAGAIPMTHTFFGPEPWIRDVETWEIAGEGNVILVGVDTDGYTTEAIETRVLEAIDFVRDELQAGPVVLNLSFALIPCGDFPQLSEDDYLAILQEGEEYDYLESLYNSLRDQELNPVEILRREEFVPVRQKVYIDVTRPALQAVFQAAYAADGTPTFSVSSDPLRALLEDALPADVVAVAAAGNDGRDFPYAPARYGNVVSVSAEYTGVEACQEILSATGQSAVLSNKAEVQMHGLYDCLPGTSFAAPRLSFEMALYLLRGGSIDCDGLFPPLDYEEGDDPDPNNLNWDDLPRQDASDDHCTSFNDLIDG